MSKNYVNVKKKCMYLKTKIIRNHNIYFQERSTLPTTQEHRERYEINVFPLRTKIQIVDVISENVTQCQTEIKEIVYFLPMCLVIFGVATTSNKTAYFPHLLLSANLLEFCESHILRW